MALAREYIKVHIISLLCANLFFEIVEAAAPPRLRHDLLRCPAQNRTVETNQALYALSRGAPMDDFLARYGHRTSSSSWEIFSTRWAEDPGAVRRLVAAYADGDLPDPAQMARETEAAGVVAMAALTAEARGLSGRALVGVTRLARRYLQLREDQRFLFDRLLYALKRALLDQGAALFGPERAADIQWLEWSEAVDLLEGRRDQSHLEPLIRTRREAHIRHAAAPPPPVFLRGEEAVESFSRGRRLSGLGISPGRVTGTVRILRSPDEAARLRRGDILVATATDPGWTPMFLVAGGAVLELGSMLSHGAVVAREYRLPTVVNVEGATRWLRDGQRVTVDGTRGAVWVEPD
jgi:pyruvate,water dikinase